MGPYDAIWLTAGGALGALARALWIHGQKNFGWETAQDVVVGAILGALYTVQFSMPILGVEWPLVPLPAHASEFQRAVMVAVIAMVSVAVVKRVLMSYAPAYMARLTGKLGGTPDSGQTPHPSEAPPAAPKS